MSLVFKVFLVSFKAYLMIFIWVLISLYLCFIDEDEKEWKLRDLELKKVASYKKKKKKLKP